MQTFKIVNATTSTILIVARDGTLGPEVTRAVTSGACGGCTLWQAGSAADARAVLRHGRPDLIVVDLRLPDIDGLVFCTQLKGEAPDVPFVVLGAVTTAEKVLSFKLGAEDVVATPCEAVELEARLEAILRRRTPAAQTARQDASPAPDVQTVSATLGKLCVDMARWRVTLDERPLDLTPTEFQLLTFMIRRPGEIISRRELAQGVWGDESMTESRTIDAYVRRIGAKLRGHGAPRILSIRGLGYQLAAPVASAA